MHFSCPDCEMVHKEQTSARVFQSSPLWSLIISQPLIQVMSLFRILAVAASLTSFAVAFDPQLGFNSFVEVETRSIDEIYQAALKEGGALTVWHGGDEKTQQNSLKTAFEARFPGMTLNITVDLSKYHDVNLDQQIATDSVYVDSIILQTLHDFPRWYALFTSAGLWDQAAEYVVLYSWFLILMRRDKEKH